MSGPLDTAKLATERLYRSFVESLGLRYDHMGLNRFMPRDQRTAIEYFVGLGENYDQEFRFQKGGRWFVTSTARLLKFQATTYKATRAEIRNRLAQYERDGLVSWRGAPWDGRFPNRHPFTGFDWSLPGGQVYADSRIMDPREFLRWPSPTYDWQEERSAVPADLPMPRISTARNCWVTGKVFNRAAFGDEALFRELSWLWDALIRLHREANANPFWSPALVSGMSPPEPCDGNNRRGHKRGPGTWTGEMNQAEEAFVAGYQDRGGYGFMKHEWPARFATFNTEDAFVPARSVDVTKSGMTIQGDGIWNNLARYWAASREQRRFVGGWADERHPFYMFADVTCDFAQAVQLAQFLTDMPPHALLHSVLCYHNWAIKTGYRQLGLPEYSSLDEYQRRMDQEAQARQEQAVANGAAAAGAVGYIFGGGSSDTISGATVATLALATSLAGPFGALGAACLMGIAFLVGWASSDRSPRQTPERQPLNDTGTPIGGRGTNFHPFRTCEGAIRGVPTLRWGAQDE